MNDPLVPADVDLRGMEFMPLYGDRLMGSETWIRASFEAKVAGIRLWWRAYAHEVPAASLPDDDALLADYAGYGVSVKAWRKVREQAMRGFVLCSDGRWYHPIVAELAMKAWALRLRERDKQRRWRERNQQTNGDIPVLVTVTQPVARPSCHAGEGEGEGELILNPMSESPAQPSIPDCPQEAILDAYRKHLPMLTQPRVWDGNRADLLRNRWRYCSKPNGIGNGYDSRSKGVEFWDDFFAYVAQSKTLTTGIPRKEGGTWKPDLPWLLKAENFAKVIEGKYHE